MPLYNLVYQKRLWIYLKLYIFKIYHHTSKADLVGILAINRSHPYVLGEYQLESQEKHYPLTE